MGKLRRDLTGKVINGILIKERVDNIGRRVAYLCVCKCGKEFITSGEHIIYGHTKSCGCLLREISSERMHRLHKEGVVKFNTQHGLTDSRIYSIWCGMKRRCNNPHDKTYARYGARGVTVADEWEKFQPFYDWAMTHGYKDNLTIDRIDGTKGYSPDNCRWVTMQTQNNNRTCNHFLVYQGVKKTIAEWSRALGIPSARIIGRLKLGWNIEDALTRPKGYKLQGGIA